MDIASKTTIDLNSKINVACNGKKRNSHDLSIVAILILGIEKQ